MVDKSETAASEDAAGDLRGTLLRRLAVAGVLVAVLLGILAFFDYLATQPEETEMPVFTEAVPVAPRKEVSQPVKPAEDEAPVASTDAAPIEAPPPPVAETAPAVVAEAPSTPASPVANAAPRRAAAVTPPPAAIRAVPAPAVQPVAPVTGVAEETAPPEPLVANARVVPPRPAEPAPPRLFAGFLLQAGVFSSVQRAEELHAKLTLSGVQSTLETRVQVGPFRTRKEAEAAQAKLKELGVQTILVSPAPRR
jgi:DedD protein